MNHPYGICMFEKKNPLVVAGKGVKIPKMVI